MLSTILCLTGIPLFTGCLATTPQAGVQTTISQNPITGQTVTNTVPVTNYVYSVSPQLSNIQSKVDMGIQTAAPIVSTFVPAAAPVAGLAQPLIDGAFGLIAAVSGLFAAYKNKQANAHSDAAAALAATVVASGQHAQALVNAAQNGSSAMVATHLAEASNPVQL